MAVILLIGAFVPGPIGPRPADGVSVWCAKPVGRGNVCVAVARWQQAALTIAIIGFFVGGAFAARGPK